MDVILATDALTVRYGRFTAVGEVTLDVRRGEVFGFLGPNGSGKTTLIKAFCGLVRIHSGSASLFGLDVRRHAGAIQNRVGYMSQRFGLYEDLTVSENIAFYGGLYGLAGAALARRRGEVMDLTGLGPYADRRAGHLSGGWKQRLALATAIVHRPDVVFLDEPTAGIDPVARRALWDLLFDLAAGGVTFFVTTHYMDEAERCGRVGYIYLGRLIALGSIRELTALPAVNPPGYVRAEIHAADVALLPAWLRLRPEVREVTIFGRILRAQVQSAGWDSLDAALRQRAPGAEMRASEVSLEDVFVTLTSNEARG